MFYAYIIQSKIDKSIYIGYTQNLENRIERHNSGKEKYTKNKKPWKLAFYCAFNTRKEATNFEKFLKTGSGREFINRRIKL